MSDHQANNKDDINYHLEPTLVHYHLEPTDEEIKQSYELYDKYKKTKRISYLKKAIKKNFTLLFNDKDIQTEIIQLRYNSISPLLDKDTKEAREFLDGLAYLKPKVNTEIAYNFGSYFRMESCLGMNFKTETRWQLIAINEFVFLYFVNRLKELWEEYTIHIGKKRFGDFRYKYFYDFCKQNNIDIHKDDPKWGSISDKTDIALTVIGRLNVKRFDKAMKNRNGFRLGKYLGKYPYFRFGTIENYYRKLNKKMKRSAKQNREIEKRIKEDEKSPNELGCHSYKMAAKTILLRNSAITKTSS